MPIAPAYSRSDAGSKNWLILGLLIASVLINYIDRGNLSIAAATAQFRRGDSNGDGRINLTDVVFTLSWLFLGGKAPGCAEACDANDDAKINLTDAVFTLAWKFRGGEPLRPPGNVCGADPKPPAFQEACVYPGCEQP